MIYGNKLSIPPIKRHCAPNYKNISNLFFNNMKENIFISLISSEVIKSINF